MDTPLPDNYELLPAEFLRKHRAQDGMLYRHKKLDKQFTSSVYLVGKPITERDLLLCDHCAPVGTIAKATTPCEQLPCNCGALTKYNTHKESCPMHPRNRYVHVMPWELVRLKEKPEGLRWTAPRRQEWTDCTLMWGQAGLLNEEECVALCVYAVPQHVRERIDAELSAADVQPELPAPAPVATGWRDIASAPKDGTVFLAFVPHSQGGFQFACCRNTRSKWACMMSGDEQNPTHWMPLPEPPAIAPVASEAPADFQAKLASITAHAGQLAKVLQDLLSSIQQTFWTSSDGHTMQPATAETLREEYGEPMAGAFEAATAALAAWRQANSKGGAL